MNNTKYITLLKKHNLNDEQIEKLFFYMKLVIEKNKQFNLTSIIEEEDFIEKHILDSLSILNYFDFQNKNILDFGTGAGIPGIILAIALPLSKFKLIDSNNKKVLFLETIIKDLKLTNVEVTSSRVETLEGKFDYVICRAVGKMNILLESSCGLIKPNGELIFYKSSSFQEEMPQSNSLLRNELGLEVSGIHEFTFLEKYNRVFVSFKMIDKPKSKYPRHFQQIKTNPLF